MRAGLLLFILSFCNLLFSQNVGINTPNPQEAFHIKSDSTKLAIRLDNKKSDQEGFDYFMVTATPANALAFEFNPNFQDWTDLNHNKLTQSDDVRMAGPQLEIVPDNGNMLRVQFTGDASIPSNAQITDVTLKAEWRRIGTYAGLMGFGLTIHKISNNLPLMSFPIQYVGNSTDLVQSISFANLFNPVTPDMINLGDIYLQFGPQSSLIQGISRLEIDRLWLEIEYKVPATNGTNVHWSAGTKEGQFMIANSTNLNSNAFLSIDESGVTQVKGLKITKNASAGKVLTSNNEGRAYWADIPRQESDVLWLNRNDTAYYANGPVQIHNQTGHSALIFDKGESRLNNGTNMIETDNRLLNVIVDANNDQSNEQISFYRDSTEILAEAPAVRFNLDNGNNWINGGGNLGVGTIAPTQKLEVNGAIKIGDTNASPAAGTIRWNPAMEDFEGFNGDVWLSLTKAKSNWGLQPANQSNENDKITGSDATTSDSFGQSVCISGDYIIIGAHLADVGQEFQQGKAYIFHKEGNDWSEQAILTANDGEEYDNFGFSVSISGNYAVVGADNDRVNGNINQGSAYVFVRSGTTWTQQAKLTASDGELNDFFGHCVSIDGNYIVVGAYADDVGANTNQGSAYVFARSGTTWTQQAQLTGSNTQSSEQFGSSVSIDGDYIVVGSPFEDVGFNASGAVYAYYRTGNNWDEVYYMTASDEGENDYFGNSVCISGDLVIVGAEGDDVGGNFNQGSAYVFQRITNTNWSQNKKLTADDGDTVDSYGHSVYISDNNIIVGAINHKPNSNGVPTGAAYIYEKQVIFYPLISKVFASDGEHNDFFGTSVSISDNYAICGSPNADFSTAANQGVAYIFVK